MLLSNCDVTIAFGIHLPLSVLFWADFDRSQQNHRHKSADRTCQQMARLHGHGGSKMKEKNTTVSLLNVRRDRSLFPQSAGIFWTYLRNWNSDTSIQVGYGERDFLSISLRSVTGGDRGSVWFALTSVPTFFDSRWEKHRFQLSPLQNCDVAFAHDVHVDSSLFMTLWTKTFSPTPVSRLRDSKLKEQRTAHTMTWKSMTCSSRESSERIQLQSRQSLAGGEGMYQRLEAPEQGHTH